MVHNGDRNVFTMFAGALETRETHVILNTLTARDERGELPRRIACGEHEHFTGGLGPGADDHMPFVEAQADAHPEALVLLAEHFDVVVNRRADAMPEHRVWTPCVVKHGVEHPCAVGREARPRNAFEYLWQFTAVIQVANSEVVAFVACSIDAVEQPAAVMAHVHAADAEEIMAL